MLNILKKVSLINDITPERGGRRWRMTVGGHQACAELFADALSVSLLLNDHLSLKGDLLYYITWLLVAHPDIHDYAIKLTPAGGWLIAHYAISTTAKTLSVEFEKHLALTYFINKLICERQHRYSVICHEG